MADGVGNVLSSATIWVDTRFVPAGAQEVWSRASNRAGQTQVEQPIANPSGYQHNAFHRHRIEVKS